jgi:signal transduction histidine kinase
MLERIWLPETLAEMVDTVAETLELSRDVASLELFLRAVSNPRLLELPPMLTIELHLRLLVALSPISDASLWTGGQVDHLRCLVQVGDAAPSRRVRHAARSTLKGNGASPTEGGCIHSVAVTRWQQSHAVLVARARPEHRRRTLAFLEEAAALLAPVLERQMLLERNAERERALVETSEKRLLRLGFDLHDGPLQDLAALAADVRQAQAQINDHLLGRGRRVVAGRLDDLGAQIGELDRTLRELARSLAPTSVLERPLVDVLRHEVETFETRVQDMRAELELGGDFTALTASQRIALYRIVQEGLSNIREHSGATEVLVRVHGGDHGVEAQIADNGKGFEVAQTLIRAAKGGHLGLVGIGERIRLLGGSFDVQSRPGEGTTLTLVLPRWESITAGQAANT